MNKFERGIEYRRYVLEKKLYHRLKKQTYFNYYGIYKFKNINDHKLERPSIIDFIGTPIYKVFKTMSTNKFDSKDKMKYSSNKGYGRTYYYKNKNRINTRIYDKSEFSKILKEYGIK